MGTDKAVSRPPATLRQKKSIKDVISIFFFHYFGFLIEFWSKVVFMINENDQRACL